MKSKQGLEGALAARWDLGATEKHFGNAQFSGGPGIAGVLSES